MYSIRAENKNAVAVQTVKERSMNKKGICVALLCLAAVLLAGCGQTGVPEVLEATSISVDKNGRMTYYLVGEFDRDYYDLSELTAMATEEAAEFSGTAGDDAPVKVNRVETLQNDPGKVLIVYEFDGSDSFNRFNGSSFFYGTVDEAAGQGYLSGVTLHSVKDGQTVTETVIRQDGTKKMIITDERALIYCPAKAAYLSEGAILKEDGSVDALGAEGRVYILIQ